MALSLNPGSFRDSPRFFIAPNRPLFLKVISLTFDSIFQPFGYSIGKEKYLAFFPGSNSYKMMFLGKKNHFPALIIKKADEFFPCDP
jgi:hypothetical protein